MAKLSHFAAVYCEVHVPHHINDETVTHGNFRLGPVILKKCTRNRMMCLSRWERIILCIIKYMSYKSAWSKNVSFYCICIMSSWSEQFFSHSQAIETMLCPSYALHFVATALMRPIAYTSRWKQMLVQRSDRVIINNKLYSPLITDQWNDSVINFPDTSPVFPAARDSVFEYNS
jgi:hypothetical protein